MTHYYDTSFKITEDKNSINQLWRIESFLINFFFSFAGKAVMLIGTDSLIKSQPGVRQTLTKPAWEIS